MPGWYKLRDKDAINLMQLLSEFRVDTHKVYSGMLGVCFSNIQSKGKPCPYFNIGYRQMADKCGASPQQAQRMIEKLERRGLIVNLGTESVKKKDNKGSPGSYVKRTFWWIAEEWGCIGNSPLSDTPLMKNPALSDTHQRATPSKGGRGVSADAATPLLVDRDIDNYPDLIE